MTQKLRILSAYYLTEKMRLTHVKPTEDNNVICAVIIMIAIGSQRLRINPLSSQTVRFLGETLINFRKHVVQFRGQ